MMKKTFATMLLGLVLASSSIAALQPPVSKVPDCWTNAGARWLSEGEYTVFINTDSLDKAALMKVLNLAGHIRNMSAYYPGFPIMCDWAGSNNCITIHENLNIGTRNNIRNGHEHSAVIQAEAEHDLKALLDFPGVQINCVGVVR
jgi:hypothetical protein